jgi:hypothetical protein
MSLLPTSTTDHKLAAHNFGCSAVLIIHFWMAGNSGDESFKLNLYCLSEPVEKLTAKIVKTFVERVTWKTFFLG